MTLKARIEERGNGFPRVGDFVAGNDGQVYRVVSISDRVQVPARRDMSNYLYGEVEAAEWVDVTDATDPVCSCRIEE
jgi:hypothetical protein